MANDQELPVKKYEYLDHTGILRLLHIMNTPSTSRFICTYQADVQLHAWGDTLKESFENVAMAMFAYMTEIDKVEMLIEQEIEITLEPDDDLLNLLFKWLDECLFVFSAEPFFIARKISIREFDLETKHIKAICYGEQFDLTKHPQGTEVKAITYSNMQVHTDKKTNDIYVIIDI
jgi:SHS2 domain-containing protein